jgi:sugar-phosphatase
MQDMVDVDMLLAPPRPVPTTGLGAVIFDMDGLLIQSEPCWQAAEYDVFRALGVPLAPEDTQATIGWRTDAVVSYWYQRHPWQGVDLAAVSRDIIARVSDKIVQDASLMPGVHQVLTLLADARIPCALATSSSHALMLRVLQHFALARYFNAACSAEFLPYAKPHPQVYLNAAQALAVDPRRCLALEDSVTGLIAAKAARMRCVAIPDAAHRHDARYGIADACWPDLHAFDLSSVQAWFSE